MDIKSRHYFSVFPVKEVEQRTLKNGIGTKSFWVRYSIESRIKAETEAEMR